MTTERKLAAKKFVRRWTGKGDEIKHTDVFWLDLLENVFGVLTPGQYIDFQKRVKINDTHHRIDAYIGSTKVLIEQKGVGKSLSAKYRQSDGVLLTPYEQAKRYNDNMRRSERPKYIITCNFSEFWVYDMENLSSDPRWIINLADLENEYSRLQFIIDPNNTPLEKQKEISVEAGKIVGLLYDAFHDRYVDPESDESLHNLNVLCVRLVFCLYAEDAEIFEKNLFHDYMSEFATSDMRGALAKLFEILATPIEERDVYAMQEHPKLAEFPYVNGGLFSGEDDYSSKIPPFTEEIKTLLLKNASADFDWSGISPTIFGAVFESTLSSKMRHEGGMHYTSVENIHKVIDPLFLDDLKEELARILSSNRHETAKLETFRQKLASMTFLDPACGSGNFLTETYLCLRALENDILRKLNSGQRPFGEETWGTIKVSIKQFYGIEINDFAVSVAKTALWIAESQMMKETNDIVSTLNDFLPLKNVAGIIKGNALQMNWEEIVEKNKLTYIIGNPPFLGYSNQSQEQKADILSIYVDSQGNPYPSSGKIDYVSAWFFKAAQMMQNSNIHTAFVATNSITQGEQVASVWKPLYSRFGIHIDFAYRTFRWESESESEAHVHCVIIGFSCVPNSNYRWLYDCTECRKAKNINAYLSDAPDIFISSRSRPLCRVLEMKTGNRPADGGHLIIEEEDYEDFIRREPKAIPYIRRLSGATEFINNKKRWCLWLVDASPAELDEMPLVMERIHLCKEDRLNNGAPDRQLLARTPSLFRETNNPDTAIIVPRVSSENRPYIPFGFIDKRTILTDSAVCIPNATLYDFGVLTSNVHMAWMRAVAGRLKSDYRYSKDIVYNNFPWPNPTDKQREAIAAAAANIMEVRKQEEKRAEERGKHYSLAAIYNDLIMPVALLQAHEANDKAVMKAYGFRSSMSEAEIVAALMKLYQQLVEES